MNKFILATIFFVASCASSPHKSSEPSWYLSPKQNNSENLYGISVGANLEEATKSALVDAAARLMVSISSESTSTIEEDSRGTNEEMRQQVRQNIEKIDFTNFRISRSEKVGPELFVEIEIKRDPFIRDQKEKTEFSEKQVSDLEKNLSASNPVQKRASLLKILDLEKQIELSSRILVGLGENIDLKEKLSRIAFFKNQLNQLSDKIEFYFEINSSKEIAQTIRTALNKEKIKVSNSRGGTNQITISIKSSSRSSEIYGAHITKLQIDFANISAGKTVASNTLEVTGSSTISEKESYAAAIKSLEEEISAEGILKVIGIVN
ncbi:MAG: LPP20 family lipoprotein [Proteobacteria bacterium]|nr:LPP20 family lipoprotein [Pseudomonadota bacterium]